MKYRMLTLELFLVKGFSLNQYSHFLHSININTIMKKRGGKWLVSAALRMIPN